MPTARWAPVCSVVWRCSTASTAWRPVPARSPSISAPPTPTRAHGDARASRPALQRCSTRWLLPDTWWWCRRPWCTAPGTTTRCRSPRTPYCGRGTSSPTRRKWRRSSNWPRPGARPPPGAPSPCCARRCRWLRTAPAGSPVRWRGVLDSDSPSTIRPRSSCTSTTSPLQSNWASCAASTGCSTWPQTGSSRRLRCVLCRGWGHG